MKKTIIAASLAAAVTGSVTQMANAANLAFASYLFDDKFSTILRNGAQAYAESKGHSMIQLDANNDQGRQIDQINNLIANGIDAVIIQSVDSSAAQPMTKALRDAGIPAVYVNRKPVPIEQLDGGPFAYVASNEIESGTLETFAMCQQLRAEGKSGGARGYLLMGQLTSEAALQRTADAEQVMALDMCNFMTLVAPKTTGEWQRTKAQDIMTNWLSSGEPFDFVIANNDEMALGAIQAMKAAGISMDSVVVGGVDATDDAIAAMKGGDLDVTVFQNAAAQGAGAVDTAIKLIEGKKVDREVYVPFELVSMDNIDQFANRNK
jgi:inositol transport system substrate-binding protein